MSNTMGRGKGWKAQKGPQAKNGSGFRALGHRLLLLGEQPEETSKGGIALIPKTIQADQNLSTTAVVVEIGQDSWCDKSTDFCDVGDTVLVGQYTGKFHKSEVDGKVYRFLNDLDVISTIET